MSAAAFARDGFVVVQRVFSGADCAQVAAHIQAGDGPGSRNMLAQPWCAQWAEQLRTAESLGALIPSGHMAVQCTYFEKSRDTNWLVPLHQDLSLPVRCRVNHPALCGWSTKQGAHFVQPPLEVLRRLIAVRVHLDDCSAADGPLRVVPGSHALGVLDTDSALAARDSRGEVTCPAAPGAAMVMRPLLLHASSKATGNSRRRVLHFLYGPASLPHGLDWALAV